VRLAEGPRIPGGTHAPGAIRAGSDVDRRGGGDPWLCQAGRRTDVAAGAALPRSATVPPTALGVGAALLVRGRGVHPDGAVRRRGAVRVLAPRNPDVGHHRGCPDAPQ